MIFEHRIWPDQPVNVSLPDDFGLDVITQALLRGRLFVCMVEKFTGACYTYTYSRQEVGPVMKGTGGVRKMRFAFRDRGKSGSTRVIYVDFEVYEKIFFVDVYQKSDKDNLTKAERNDMKDVVELIELGLEAEKQRRENYEPL